jgi:hypothetical protein
MSRGLSHEHLLRAKNGTSGSTRLRSSAGDPGAWSVANAIVSSAHQGEQSDRRSALKQLDGLGVGHRRR